MTGWATYTLISCAEANLSSDGDNYAKYDKIVLGGVGKTVYIKSGHSWSEYAAMVENKTFTETEGRIIKCNLKPGVMAPDANHGYCDNERPHGELDVGPGEKWKGYTYSPYPERESKDKLYYSYYLEPGHTDVALDDFVDEYWIWCTSWATNMFGTKYCETSAPGGVNVLTYFVDGERFWDGYEGHELDFAFGAMYTIVPSMLLSMVMDPTSYVSSVADQEEQTATIKYYTSGDKLTVTVNVVPKELESIKKSDDENSVSSTMEVHYVKNVFTDGVVESTSNKGNKQKYTMKLEQKSKFAINLPSGWETKINQEAEA